MKFSLTLVFIWFSTLPLTSSSCLKRHWLASFISLIVCSFDLSSRVSWRAVFSKTSCGCSEGGSLSWQQVRKRRLVMFSNLVVAAHWGHRCAILSQVFKLRYSLVCAKFNNATESIPSLMKHVSARNRGYFFFFVNEGVETDRANDLHNINIVIGNRE